MGTTIYQARVQKEEKRKELLWRSNETVYPSSQDVWKHRWKYKCTSSRTSLMPHTALPWYRKVKTKVPRIPGHSAARSTTRKLRKAAASSSFLGNVHQYFQNWLSCSRRRHIRLPVSQFCFSKFWNPSLTLRITNKPCSPCLRVDSTGNLGEYTCLHFTCSLKHAKSRMVLSIIFSHLRMPCTKGCSVNTRGVMTKSLLRTPQFLLLISSSQF